MAGCIVSTASPLSATTYEIRHKCEQCHRFPHVMLGSCIEDWTLLAKERSMEVHDGADAHATMHETDEETDLSLTQAHISHAVCYKARGH